MATLKTFKYGHATHPDWREAGRSSLKQLGNAAGASLGFVYLTDLLADDAPEIVSFLREQTGVAHWIGTVGVGICATGREYLDEPAIAVMAGEFDYASFK